MKGVLLNVVGREDNMSMLEVTEASGALTDWLDGQVKDNGDRLSYAL